MTTSKPRPRPDSIEPVTYTLSVFLIKIIVYFFLIDTRVVGKIL